MFFGHKLNVAKHLLKKSVIKRKLHENDFVTLFWPNEVAAPTFSA